jgi:acyl carrier protein
MNPSIETRLKTMIAERLYMDLAPETIENDKSLIESYGVDSVSLLELVVGLEEEFGIEVGDDEFSIANFETVAALAALVRAKEVV